MSGSNDEPDHAGHFSHNMFDLSVDVAVLVGRCTANMNMNYIHDIRMKLTEYL